MRQGTFKQAEPQFDLRFEVAFVDYEGHRGSRELDIDEGAGISESKVEGVAPALTLLAEHAASWSGGGGYLSGVVDGAGWYRGGSGKLVLLAATQIDRGGRVERLRATVTGDTPALERLLQKLEADGLISGDKNQDSWTPYRGAALATLE